MPRTLPTGETVCRLHNQNFKRIRSWCLKRGYLFEDPHFKMDSQYEWKRPPEISEDPRLFVEGTCQYDVLQGELGNCWMLAAIATLAMHQDLVRTVIPENQSFSSKYAGIFHFRFWQFGKWFDVVIDDRLPTEKGNLVNTRSPNQNEFWSALLEKAYCKVIGGEYKVADAGNLCEALEDFTGGVVEQFLLRYAPRNFQNILLKSVERNSLVGCFIDDDSVTQATTSNGLIKGHSYSVTGVKSVNLPGHGDIVLIRLRNPWGNYEWTGPWSDHSTEWASVPENIQQEMGIVCREDGEFWMAYSDFMSNFNWVDMCHLSPGAFIGDHDDMCRVESTWQLNMFRGSWIKGVSAGGCKSIHKNPQMRFILSEADTGNIDGISSVLVALIQRTSGTIIENYNEIGYKIYEIQDPNYQESTLDRKFFLNNRSVFHVPVRRVREVAGRTNLPLGSYCVVPFTYEASIEGEFLVRIFSEKKTVTEQVDDRIGISADVIGVDRILTYDTKDYKKSDSKLVDYFKKVSDGAMKVGWEDLRSLLDTLVKDKTLSEDLSDWGNYSFFYGIASSAYQSIFWSNKKKDAFSKISPGGFSKDLCRSMVALLDPNHSGKLMFEEFKVLWDEIKKWKSIYELYSDEFDGYLYSSALKEALGAGGFQLNNNLLTDIVHGYATVEGYFTFDEFLQLGLKIKTISQLFTTKEEKVLHEAEFTLDRFIEKALYYS